MILFTFIDYIFSSERLSTICIVAVCLLASYVLKRIIYKTKNVINNTIVNNSNNASSSNTSNSSSINSNSYSNYKKKLRVKENSKGIGFIPEQNKLTNFNSEENTFSNINTNNNITTNTPNNTINTNIQTHTNINSSNRINLSSVPDIPPNKANVNNNNKENTNTNNTNTSFLLERPVFSNTSKTITTSTKPSNNNNNNLDQEPLLQKPMFTNTNNLSNTNINNNSFTNINNTINSNTNINSNFLNSTELTGLYYLMSLVVDHLTYKIADKSKQLPKNSNFNQHFNNNNNNQQNDSSNSNTLLTIEELYNCKENNKNKIVYDSSSISQSYIKDKLNNLLNSSDNYFQELLVLYTDVIINKVILDSSMYTSIILYCFNLQQIEYAIFFLSEEERNEYRIERKVHSEFMELYITKACLFTVSISNNNNSSVHKINKYSSHTLSNCIYNQKAILYDRAYLTNPDYFFFKNKLDSFKTESLNKILNTLYIDIKDYANRPIKESKTKKKAKYYLKLLEEQTPSERSEEPSMFEELADIKSKGFKEYVPRNYKLISK